MKDIGGCVLGASGDPGDGSRAHGRCVGRLFCLHSLIDGGHSGGPPPRVGPGGVEGRGEATSLELAADDWRTRRRPGERCSWSQSVREKQKTIRCCPYTGSRAFQVTAATRGATPECSPHAVSVEVLCASFQKVLQTAEHFVKLHARGVLTQQHLRAAHIRLPLEHLTRRLPGESRW